MRTVYMLNSVSIDGHFASNNDETCGMDWFVPDPEVEKTVHKLIRADTLVLGKETYLGFERSWVPHLKNPDASGDLKRTAERLSVMTKVVFSTSLKEVAWENT